MKFMELDSEGFIHHIMDDPCITMLPVVNRFQHNNTDGTPIKDSLGRPISSRGGYILGVDPVDHPPELMPSIISDEDFAMLMKDGLTGVHDRVKKTGKWAYKWDFQSNKPVKVNIL